MANPTATHLLGLCYHANEMNNSAIVNHWIQGHTPDEQYHVNKMHEQFASMAKILGYDIKLKSEVTS